MPRNTGCRGNRVQRGVLIAVGEEEPQRSFRDALARLPAFALPQTFGCAISNVAHRIP